MDSPKLGWAESEISGQRNRIQPEFCRPIVAINVYMGRLVRAHDCKSIYGTARHEYGWQGLSILPPFPMLRSKVFSSRVQSPEEVVRILVCSLLTVSFLGRAGVVPFEARSGQYLVHGPGYALSVTSHEATLNLRGRTVHMSVAGAHSQWTVEANDRMPGKASYFLGRNVRASYDLYGRVRWHDAYPGIDVVFRGNQECLEYDLEIGARRDPDQIQLSFDGVADLRIDGHGVLVLSAGAVQIEQPKPVAYQLSATGKTEPVDVSYWIDAENHVRFRTGAYDRRRPLVIDPKIVFDKTFGGSGYSSVAGMARDSQGSLYVAGTTNSSDFGTVHPIQSHLGSGPLFSTTNFGQSWTYSTVGTATFVNAMVAAPSMPVIVYAATPTGVFKSADGGTTWTATAGTGLTTMATALAVDTGSSTTVYAATATGVFVSSNGGTIWQASTTGASTGIVAIAADPAKAGTVFVSAEDPPGLFRSTNYGQTWTQLSPASFINALAIAPNGDIVAATYTGLLLSTDGGNSWTAGAQLSLYGNNSQIAIAPGSPFTLYLTSPSGVQRSTDGGKTVSVVLSSVQDSSALIAVDPRNPSTVYIADYGVLYRSTNAGQSWSQVPLPSAVAPQWLFIGPADSRVFVAAYTQSTVFVTKWSADGSQVLYSTYLGGNGGDSATAIAVDGAGSAYVTGSTYSADFPTTAGAFQTKLIGPPEVFVVKLSPDGSQLLYSTLLGTSSTLPPDISFLGTQVPGSYGIAVDSAGDAVVTGFTAGNFPVTANAFQATPVPGCYMTQNPNIPTAGSAFIAKIAPMGNSLIYSSFLGGTCATYGTSVALDANGDAWVAGGTLSPDFPVTPDALQPKFGGGVYDGFLARVSASGSLEYATYLGGSGYDSLNALALDQSGNLYVTGESSALSQPASAGAYQPQANASCPEFFIGPSEYYPQGDAIVVKLDPTGHTIERLTYEGGSNCLNGTVIAVDSSGEPWIAGPAIGNAPPTVSPFQIGIGYGFIGKFSADFTQLLFSTYFDPVSGLTLDSSGAAYVAGTGTSTNYMQPVYLAKIDPTPPAISLDSVVSAVTPANPTFSLGIAAGEVIRLLGTQMGPATATPGVIKAGVLATNTAAVQVTFDGTAVPLLSVSAQEIDLVAPFELAGKSTTTIQVDYNGVQSNAVQIPVTPQVLQILGVYNEDFSLNTASNPAKPGSAMSLYFAGIGQTNPPSRDGQINTTPLAAPSMPVQLPGGLTITFTGAAPGLAAGIFQVNFVAPPDGFTSTSFSVFVQP